MNNLGQFFLLSLKLRRQLRAKNDALFQTPFFLSRDALERLLQETDRINIANARDVGIRLLRRIQTPTFRSAEQTFPANPCRYEPDSSDRARVCAYIVLFYRRTCVFLENNQYPLEKTPAAGDDVILAPTLDIIGLRTYRKDRPLEFTVFQVFLRFEAF